MRAQSVIEAHDDVGSKNYEPGGLGGDAALPGLNTSGFLLGVNGFVPDEQALTRMVGIQKTEEEPLVLSRLILISIIAGESGC